MHHVKTNTAESAMVRVYSEEDLFFKKNQDSAYLPEEQAKALPEENEADFEDEADFIITPGMVRQLFRNLYAYLRNSRGVLVLCGERGEDMMNYLFAFRDANPPATLAFGSGRAVLMYGEEDMSRLTLPLAADNPKDFVAETRRDDNGTDNFMLPVILCEDPCSLDPKFFANNRTVIQIC